MNHPPSKSLKLEEASSFLGLPLRRPPRGRASENTRMLEARRTLGRWPGGAFATSGAEARVKTPNYRGASWSPDLTFNTTWGLAYSPFQPETRPGGPATRGAIVPSPYPSEINAYVANKATPSGRRMKDQSHAKELENNRRRRLWRPNHVIGRANQPFKCNQ